MTDTRTAKKLLTAEIVRLGLEMDAGPILGNLTARTISFQDLARASRVFVTVRGLRVTREEFAALKSFAHLNGFILEVEGLSILPPKGQGNRCECGAAWDERTGRYSCAN